MNRKSRRIVKKERKKDYVYGCVSVPVCNLCVHGVCSCGEPLVVQLCVQSDHTVREKVKRVFR